MRQRVFWKILVGFWITTILITQGVWLMFVVLRPPESESVNTDTFVASAARALLERDGGVKLKKELDKWSPHWRSQIQVEAVPAGTPGAVTDSTGATYRTVVHPRQGHHGHGPLDVPWEVILVSIFGGLAFSAVLSVYLTTPVQRIRTGFDQLAKGDFGARLGPSMGRRRDEISDLAHDFDVMASRLQELVSHRDRLLASISHEIRTPLTRLQLAIGLAHQEPTKIDASLERIKQEAIKLDEMVGEILTLSRLESSVEAEDEYFDLAQIVDHVANDARFEAAPKQVLVRVDDDCPATEDCWLMRGSGKLIARAVENVVRNAVRFSPEGGTVTISLRRTGPELLLSVRDNGPGVAPERLAEVFRPFVQGGINDNQGFGLGLAIAERAVRAHSGTISADNIADGGFEISIRLPAEHLES